MPVGWYECDVVGAGCLMVHRSVLEKRPEPFRLSRVAFEAGKLNGEDVGFSKLAKADGHTIWSHGSYQCSHLCDQDLLYLIQRQGFNGMHTQVCTAADASACAAA